MLGASVSFLAIPDLEDIARLAGVAAAACSLGSLAAGIVRLRLPSFSSGKEGGQGADDDEQEPRPSALRTFALLNRRVIIPGIICLFCLVSIATFFVSLSFLNLCCEGYLATNLTR